MIFQDKPEDFDPKIEVASCFIEHDGKILLLLRQDHKPQGNTWGIPAGKLNKHEDKKTAILREVQEEVSVVIPEGKIEHFRTVYVRYPDYDFPYHMFIHLAEAKPEIILDTSAHKEYAWKTPEEALQMNLIPDEDKCIKLFYNL